ncbi:MAG: hypothetical protein LBI42_09535 [Chitinispirillales bacterium]|jgi:hypothetical protein|nr:hypothetical protein [Chitinispirillales bacterium]
MEKEVISMDECLNKLQDILSKKYKVKLFAKILQLLGIILFISQLLVFFGVGKDIFPALGWTGIFCSLAICLLIILGDNVAFRINKQKELIDVVETLKNNHYGCKNSNEKKHNELTAVIEGLKNNIHAGKKSANNDCKIELITDAKTLVKRNIQIVDEAEECIYATGSRSRDAIYLKTIENKISLNGEIVYYRVLYGNPYHQALKKHLEEVLDIRDPNKRPHGAKTTYLGIYSQFNDEPEKFVCANEKQALVVLPSFKGAGNYDTAIVFTEKEIVDKLCNYVRTLYVGSTKLENIEAVKNLNIISEKAEHELSK